MKKIPGWLVWAFLVFAWWAAWELAVHGSFRSKDARLDAERCELGGQKAQALQLIAATPTLVHQIDSLDSVCRHVAAGLPAVDHLDRLLNELRSHGEAQGITSAEIALDLASLLRIPVGCPPAPGSFGRPDAVWTEFSASGSFHAIGSWLDGIEQRADFVHWSRCRWEATDQDGMVSFTGRAAFRVLVPAEVP